MTILTLTVKAAPGTEGITVKITERPGQCDMCKKFADVDVETNLCIFCLGEKLLDELKRTIDPPDHQQELWDLTNPPE